MPHVAVFNALQEYSVTPIPEERVRVWEENGDCFWSVAELEQRMQQAYEEEVLLNL